MKGKKGKQKNTEESGAFEKLVKQKMESKTKREAKAYHYPSFYIRKPSLLRRWKSKQKRIDSMISDGVNITQIYLQIRKC